jgi:hypothetical protein
VAHLPHAVGQSHAIEALHAPVRPAGVALNLKSSDEGFEDKNSEFE